MWRVILVVFVAACAPPGRAVGGGGVAGAAAAPEALESELAKFPADTNPANTIPRSQILRALGRQPQAVSELEGSLDEARKRLDWRGLSDLWRELGDVQIEIGRPQDALETYAKRLTNAKSLDETRDRAFAQVDMAYAFANLSQWTPAQHALEDAEVLAKGDLEHDPASLEKMAYVREKLLAREVAIELFDHARAAYAQNGDATGEARAAIQRAYLVALERESSAPLDGSLDALAARARDPEVAARLLRYRGEAAYLFDHQYPRCFQLAQQGLPIAEHRGIAALSKTMNVLASVCAAKLDDTPRAIAAAERAVVFAEDAWRATSVPSARQAAGFEALLLYRHILSLDVKLPEPQRVAAAFEAMEHARGRAYLDAAVRGGAGLVASAVEVPPLLAQDKQDVEAHVAELDKQIAAGKDDPAQVARRRDALWALEDVKAAIAFQNPLLVRLSPPPLATLDRVRAMLDDKTLLVAYLMTNDQAIAIAVTKTAQRLWVVDGGRKALAAQVHDLREEGLLTPGPIERVRGRAQGLYKKLLAPASDLVDASERIIILPHGTLATLPFEALVDEHGKFLVENHVVTYHQSATLALEDTHAKQSKARRAFVGLGDPVYDWAAFRAGKPEGVPVDGRGIAFARGLRRGLARLPGTAREVKGIAALFGGDAKLYLRDQASEENVKAGILGGTRMIHIASHGIFDTDYQALVLTMRPDAADDGFLLQSELAELHLDADLVVLSACETGRAHEVLAEPVSGLALALRTAGARRMVASLWEVDDDATAELMKSFYAPIAKHDEAFAQALTDAKRALLANPKWQHPYYWAAFVLVGS